MTHSPSAIVVDEVSKQYPGAHALDRISLVVREHEFVALLGPSGCGKSTLIRLIGGLEPIDAGGLTVLNKSPDRARRDRDFGIVFQDPALFPWRTVLQNVRLPGEVFHSAELQAAAVEWVRRVGLEGFENALPSSLSGGMRSRVAIARALVSRPRILIMDEPFGALDEITRIEMHRELLNLWAETKPTVLFVTHGVAEALFLADRVVVMSARPGRITYALDVPFPRPRTPDLRASTEFAGLTELLFAQLLKG